MYIAGMRQRRDRFLLLRVKLTVIPQAVTKSAEAVGVFGGDSSSEVEDDVS